VPHKPNTSSEQIDFIELFLRVKSAIERVLDQEEISVEFYSLLPVELEKPFEELIESIRSKLQADSYIMPAIEEGFTNGSIEQALNDIPEDLFEEVLQHHSA